LEPEAKHIPLALQVDADRDVTDTVTDSAAVPDLHDQRVEEEDRVDVFERPCLPLTHVVEHGVGDARDQIVADLDVVDLGQVSLDLAHRHPTAVHRDDPLVEAMKAALMLRHDLRFERTGPVTRLLDPHRPMLGMDRLRRHPVASVADPARRSPSTLVAEMIRQLGIHRSLNQPLGQPRKQPVRASDLLRRPCAGKQLIDQLVRQLVRTQVRVSVDRQHLRINQLIRQNRPSSPASPPLGTSPSGEQT
jgi:hypothetical protein